MNLFSGISADAVFINRLDPNEILGTVSNHGFQLEDQYWPSAEHYYQATKYSSPMKEKIRACDTPLRARKMGRSIFRRKRSDWKAIRETVMTRALYTKCRTHPEASEALLDTEAKPIANNAFGEYHWGIGRDGRGKNCYGKVLQNIRERLRMEAASSATTSVQPDEV